MFFVGYYVRFGWSFKAKHMIGYFSTLAASLAMYYMLHGMGASKLSAQGRVEEGGLELEKPGLHQYMMDYIYIAALTHLLAAFTPYAWLILLSVISPRTAVSYP